jgi:tetratricopeptide (TPR) repeat protein
MHLLPPALEAALKRAPKVVIAPVGVGFGQDALAAWAERAGRAVDGDPSKLTGEPSLLLCERRSHLSTLPRDLPLDEVLVLDEADVVFDLASWRQALRGCPSNFAEATFEQAEGWPAGLELALRVAGHAADRETVSGRHSAGWEGAVRIGRGDLALHQHPLATVALERLLPAGARRKTLESVANTPLLVPDLRGPLGLDRLAPGQAGTGEGSVEELVDAGFLRSERDGLALPRLLRRYLRPRMDPGVSLTIARILMSRHHLDEALSALAEGEHWQAYLELLAEGYEPHSSAGEARLRRALRLLPEAAHASAEYLYLVGSLERMRGELGRAQERYRTARREASGLLRARIDNARGIAFALQGRMEEARKAFASAVTRARSEASGGGRTGQAARLGSASAAPPARQATGASLPSADHGARTASVRLEGEARHNRAGVFIQQGRFEEAEKDLRRAVASFREGGHYVREARSLQLLALSWHRRGLLHEARKGYEEALELLATLGQPTALLRTNLAEVLLLAGQAAEAKAHLEQAAADAQHDARVLGYVETNLAMWTLGQGQPEPAARRLANLLRQEGLEAHLRAEAELLLARALRLQGQREEALEHARAAAPVGVAAALEQALCEGGDLSEVIGRAREEEARFELATALLNRGEPGDPEEALELIRSHGYRILLDAPQHAPALAALAQDDPATLELFPLRMTTFGGFRVRFLGRSLSLAEFPTRKSAALLLRLALASRPLPREALADEFWGDAGNPIHSLQTALYHLNRTLSAQVVGGRKGVVEVLYPVVLDVTEFERIAAETLEGPWARGADGIRRALAVAEGEPLADFPEWFDEERRLAEALQLRLWRRLSELERPQPRRAAEALEALLRLDPYDVESRRNLIGIYTELGEAEQVRRQEERLRLLESGEL